MAVIIGHRGTAHFLIARWATGRFAHGACVGALGLPLAIFHRRHDPVERHRHRHRLVGDRLLLAQHRFKVRPLRLPVDTQLFGQTI